MRVIRHNLVRAAVGALLVPIAVLAAEWSGSMTGGVPVSVVFCETDDCSVTPSTDLHIAVVLERPAEAEQQVMVTRVSGNLSTYEPSFTIADGKIGKIIKVSSAVAGETILRFHAENTVASRDKLLILTVEEE